MKNLIVIMVLLAVPVSCVFAGDVQTMSVSCTIPAIPGINAPLQEEIIRVAPSLEIVKEAPQQTRIAAATGEEEQVTQEQVDSGAVKLYTYCAK